PLSPEETVQGCLEIFYDLNKLLCEITGMDEYTMALLREHTVNLPAFSL
ncbi:unnamed protein product, partial [marine sediment metagenome]